MDWHAYQEATRDRAARPLLVRALSHVSAKNAALDLGAGAFGDTRALLDAGFARVVAIDRKFYVAAPVSDRLEVVEKKFEEYEYPTDLFDLINAQYSLPFIARSDLARVWALILASLAPGGVIVGQFFGDRDSWVGERGVTCLAKNEAEALLAPLEIIEFSEEEADGPTAAGQQKHWHVLHFIARR